MKNLNIKLLLIFAFDLLLSPAFSSTTKGKPNVLWIFIEDASCHISCYGETAIQTPNIDALAAEGVRFENAFVTAPVCSPSRSALVTGMYQTTSGSHNHRSQVNTGKGGGNTDYYSSYELSAEIPLASKLFEKAGYYTTNEKLNGETGKQDYNFVQEDIYSGTSWKNSPNGTPFFSQIQLHGGKNRKRVADTENFKLPPYYFEDEIMREDWKEYLGSWLDTDQDLKQIVADLKKVGVYDNTLIFFLTDHGISHLRGKQFVYDEGVKVPLIVKFPNNKKKGTVRNDLVKQIDLLPSSLAYIGIPIPENIQGVDIFFDKYKNQDFVVSTRDRCDETTEIIRSVRTPEFRYIRNFLSYRPHAQRNQYKDGKKISKHMRELFQNGKLDELQARFYQPTRPAEELYAVENDPFQINNLANDPKYKSKLTELRTTLYNWMKETNDPGLIPEPILEDLGKKYGNKYTAMKQAEYTDINKRLIQIIEAGENQNIPALLKAINSKESAERYWAATWLGVNKVKSAKKQVEVLTKDKNPSVRIAANLAFYKIDSTYDPIPALGKEVNDKNLIVGMYAMNAIEQTGIRNGEVRKIAETASKSVYDFTQRFGKFLMDVVSEKE
ncbi:MAG: sulfatase-like hydrolase/transferase [Bacteroidetes bacterium]|nr:sulfatase-like hydrolase/transferase [Bacteroidota bacterium]